MTTRTWKGGTGFFDAASNWIDGTAPVVGDDVVIASGVATVRAGQQNTPRGYEGYSISLGSTDAANAAGLVLDGATVAHFTDVTSGTANPFATVTSIGTSIFQGSIEATASGGRFTIQATTTDTAKPADFLLAQGGTITVGSGDTLRVVGRLDDHGDINVSGGTITVDGTLSIVGGTMTLQSATLNGTGEIDIGMLGKLTERAIGASTVAVRFVGAGGSIDVNNASPAAIHGFQAGDQIEIDNIFGADFADVEAGKLTVRVGGASGSVAYQVAFDGPAASGVLATSSSGATIFINAANSLPLGRYAAQAADHALKADVARATLHTKGGAALDGSGTKIGIISDSFNANQGTRPNDEAVAGYLPLKADGKTSAVTVLGDYQYGKDEGRAMAELIHQIAPGSQLYFSSGETDYAAAVTALANAGCNIIVDDLGDGDAYYRPASALDKAIESVVARGVDYFAAAGNSGDTTYNGNFAAGHVATTLYDGSAADAFRFYDSTPYQTFVTTDFSRITLQWDVAAFNGPAPEELVFKVFDAATHALIKTSTQDNGSNGLGASESLYLSNAGRYQIAIYNPSGEPSPAAFRYEIHSYQGNTTVAVIADPTVGQGPGTVEGHETLADINSVGAVAFSETPAYGGADGIVDFYSSGGPGQTLYDAAGNRLPTPKPANKPDFVAPSGSGTAVPSFEAFYGTSAAAPVAAAVAALVLQANPTLTTAQVTGILKQSAIDLGAATTLQGAGLIQADQAVALALVQCFAAGTLIATPDGERPIEAIRAGDRVTLARGGCAPVSWAGGRRIDCRKHPQPEQVWPVRIAAGAFGDELPRRDLLLSPNHAVFTDGVLIPAKHLVNGSTIRRELVEKIEYFHLELDQHDVIFAEGLPAESLLDAADRHALGATPATLHPDFSQRLWEAEGCAPLVVAGPRLAAVQDVLACRASGYPVAIAA